jgi:hypothetical protein
MFENLLALLDKMGVAYNRLNDNEIIIPAPALAAKGMLSDDENFSYLSPITTGNALNEEEFDYLTDEACIHILYEEEYDSPLSWTVLLGENWE